MLSMTNPPRWWLRVSTVTHCRGGVQTDLSGRAPRRASTATPRTVVQADGPGRFEDLSQGRFVDVDPVAQPLRLRPFLDLARQQDFAVRRDLRGTLHPGDEAFDFGPEGRVRLEVGAVEDDREHPVHHAVGV